jgi:predicted nucleotidyltransferase
MYSPAGTRKLLLGHEDHVRLVNAAVRVLEAEPEILAAYLYGSAARGEPAADLDVALLLKAPTLESSRLEALAARLQAEGAPVGPPIDLRVLWGAGPRFQVTVLKEGRVLFERDRDQRLESEAMLMSRWADFKPTWERLRQRMRDRWLDG